MKRLFSLLLLMLILAGCGGSEESSSPAASDKSLDRTLRINVATEPETLDPALMRGTPEGKVARGLFEPLLDLDEKGEFHPGAAVRWEHNEDFTAWTFHLRPDARWHNGEPVTAQDYVYAVRRVCTPATAAPYAAMVYQFLRNGETFYKAGGNRTGLPFDGVEALDTHTVRYNMANPTPFFESVVTLFTWLPVNRNAVEKGGDAWYRNPETCVGNGPFRMTLYRGHDRIETVRAETYWDAKSIWWEKVVYLMIESETTENAAFINGELDVTNSVAIPELDYWRDRPEYRMATFFGSYYVSFACQKPPFDDARVRRAFALAIDREMIVTQVTKRNEPIGGGLVPRGLRSPAGGDYRDRAGDMIGAHDPAEAKRLLAAAGYGPGGKPFPAVEYIYNNLEEHKIIGENLQAMWKQALGVEPRLQSLEWGVWLKKANEGDYNISRNSWYGDYMDAMTFLELFTSESQQNSSKFFNKEYDDLIARARGERDALKREDLLIAAERLLVEKEAVVAPLFTYRYPMLVQSNIEGVYRHALGGLVYAHGRRR